MALNKVNIEFLRTQMDKVLVDIEKLKTKIEKCIIKMAVEVINDRECDSPTDVRKRRN